MKICNIIKIKYYNYHNHKAKNPFLQSNVIQNHFEIERFKTK